MSGRTDDTNPDGAAATPPRSAVPDPRLVALTVAGALFMEFHDQAALGTALPVIAAEFGVPAVTLSGALTIYLLALAVFLPVSAFAAERFGARRVFVAAIGLYLVGALLSAASTGVASLLVGRGVQGIGAALMVPVGRLLVVSSVPRERLVDTLAWLTLPALAGPMIGPVTGGFLATAFDWRAIFLVDLPLGAAVAVLAWRRLPERAGSAARRFDGVGFALLATGLVAALAALEGVARVEGARLPALAAAVVAVAAGAVYLRHARRRADPLLDLGVWRVATLRASVTGGSVFRLGVGAVPFLLPMMLQLGFGWSALHSGLTTFVTAMGAMGMKLLAGRLIGAFGHRAVLAGASVAAGAATAAIAAIEPTWPLPALLGLLFLGGFLRSLAFTAVNTLGYGDVAEAELARATTLVTMAQQVALTAGVALAAALVAVAAGGSGAAPTADAFRFAFLVTGAVMAAAAVVFLRLPADAGAAVRPRRPGAGDQP